MVFVVGFAVRGIHAVVLAARPGGGAPGRSTSRVHVAPRPGSPDGMAQCAVAGGIQTRDGGRVARAAVNGAGVPGHRHRHQPAVFTRDQPVPLERRRRARGRGAGRGRPGGDRRGRGEGVHRGFAGGAFVARGGHVVRTAVDGAAQQHHAAPLVVPAVQPGLAPFFGVPVRARGAEPGVYGWLAWEAPMGR